MKKIITLSLVCLISLMGFSQERSLSKEKLEKMEKLKQAYIILELELEEKKAAEFKAIYEAYEAEKKEMRAKAFQERKTQMEKLEREAAETTAKKQEMTEKEALEKLEAHLEREQARINLEKKYLDEMVKSIGALKVLEYKKVEKEFKRELMHMYKDDKRRHHMERELRERREMMRKERMRR